MKILQLIFNLSSGGAEKFTVDLSNELAESNEVYLCVIQEETNNLSFFKEKISKKVKYINLAYTKGINYKTFITIFRIIKKIKPDVIHAHLNVVLYLYLPSLIFKNKIKFIHTLHNIAPKTIGFKWQKFINYFFYKYKIIDPVAISQECKSSYIEFYNLKNISLIMNGVANPLRTKNFSLVKKEINKLKNDRSDIIFIHIARFNKQKNQSLLIDTFNKLIDERNDVILLIIGDYFNTKAAEEIKKKSKKGIYYLGAKINIIDYLLISDAFVLSSLWEGLPISLLEALSCGVVPVCTPAGGIPDVIKDETIGFLAKDFSEEGLYEAVNRFLNEAGDFNHKNLVDYYNKNFSMYKCAINYESIYME